LSAFVRCSFGLGRFQCVQGRKLETDGYLGHFILLDNQASRRKSLFPDPPGHSGVGFRRDF
jgi:hypothetical protein